MVQDVKEKLFAIDSKRLELDHLQRRFIVECKRFAARIVEEKIRSAISLNHEKAMALGREGLKPIKNQVNQIIDTISDSVEEIVNNDKLWLHTIEEPCSNNFHHGQYLMKGNQGPEILEIAVRKLLSPLGKILLQYDLDSVENWEKKTDYMHYRQCIDWSIEMKECIEQYKEQLDELSGLVKEYEYLSRETPENDALELWDSL